MDPKIIERLKELSGQSGIDISGILPPEDPMSAMGGGGNLAMGSLPPAGPILPDNGLGGDMPLISAEIIYDKVKPDLLMLDANEMLKFIHLLLMEKIEVMGE